MVSLTALFVTFAAGAALAVGSGRLVLEGVLRLMERSALPPAQS